MTSGESSNFVNSTKEGVERVLAGNYAYLIESTMNEYYTRRNCELVQVGGLFDIRGYAIGLPKGDMQCVNVYCKSLTFQGYYILRFSPWTKVGWNLIWRIYIVTVHCQNVRMVFNVA